METTKNYEMFKFKSGNRNLDRNHINKLKKSITQYGFLQSKPIIVNEDCEIIDGQHRFIALKEMGMEIPYVVEPDIDDMLITLNVTQKNWTIKDYIKHYAKNGKESYKRLLRLSNEMKLDPTSILSMGYRNSYTNGDDTKRIKEGTLIFTLDNELCAKGFYDNYIQVISSLRLMPKSKLCQALIDVSNRKNFNWHRMLNRAYQYPTLAYNCRTKQEYTDMLVKLYNHDLRLKENRI